MIEKISLFLENGKVVIDKTLEKRLNELQLNLDKILEEIREKTKEYEGIKLQAIIEIDTETKKYSIKIKAPTTSYLIKKVLGIEKAKITKEEKEKGMNIGNLKFDQVIKIAKIKMEDLESKNLKNAVKQIIGSCVSMQGILIENKNPKEILGEVKEGKWDDFIK